MPVLTLPQDLDLSGLSNASIGEMLELGLQEFERREALRVALGTGRSLPPSPRTEAAAAVTVIVPLAPTMVEALVQLAAHEGRSLDRHIEYVLTQHCRAWSAHLKMLGYEVPNEP